LSFPIFQDRTKEQAGFDFVIEKLQNWQKDFDFVLLSYTFFKRKGKIAMPKIVTIFFYSISSFNHNSDNMYYSYILF
jgi:hypothetical protein